MFVKNRLVKATDLSAYHHLFGRDAPSRVRPYLAGAYQDKLTPLHRLPTLAKATGVGQIYAKDEGYRCGLQSFKALGGSFAVARLAQQWATNAIGRDVSTSELRTPHVRRALAAHTVTCATDGNHGRSVAWGALEFGCKAIIFVHHRVDAERVAAIRNLGAEIITVEGTYDDAVSMCVEFATTETWQVVSDTAWAGYEDIPGLIMQGYTVMIDEALSEAELNGARVSHLFLQGGVGGLAAACAAYSFFRYGEARPKIIVVEPDFANCLLQSALAGKCIKIPTTDATVMGMLECFQPSILAWRILESLTDIFMDVSNEEAIAAMRSLAFPNGDDGAIVAGESGAAGLAGLTKVMSDPDTREYLGLNERSSVLVIISEGATAPKRYFEHVGKRPDEIVNRLARLEVRRRQ